MTPEAKVKLWFMNLVEKRYGHLAIWSYAPPGGYFGQNGTSDRLLLIESGDGSLNHLYQTYGRPPGVMAAIEIKADGNTPTPLQLKRLRDIDRAGGVAASLIGKDLAKVTALFEEIDRRREMCRLAWRITIGLHSRDESLSSTSERLSNSS